ncbi:MAG: hypothetical protein U0441_19855 [Polyangiaceae bacterium]
MSTPLFPRRRADWLALFGAVGLVAALKVAVVLLGPDYDGDAYAHAMAGRRMLLTPGDAAIHWVWLPLLHALHAAATFAGGGLQTIRLGNALISSVTPLLLAAYLAKTSGRVVQEGASPEAAESVVPWLAGALLALDPLCLWLGVTGQTEPLFQLLVLGVCVAAEQRAFVTGGLLFAAAALTRYEAWPLVAVGVWVANRDWLSRGDALPRGALSSRRERIRLRSQAIWLLPAAAIAAWIVWHARATGEWLQFLRYNRDFVQGYLGGVGYPWGREPIYPLMAVFYLTVVPVWNMLGPAYLLGIAGIRRAIRESPRVFVVTSVALIAIVTGGLLRKTHLGLPRHAVVFAPFFCLVAALGTEALADRIARRYKRFAANSLRPRLAIALIAFVALSRTLPGAVSLIRATRGAFAEQAEAARALVANASPREAIFCEDGKIEVLSALAPDRFIRWQIPDVAPEHVASLAAEKGSALVITTPDRAAHLRGGQPLWTNGHLTLWRYLPR